MMYMRCVWSYMVEKKDLKSSVIFLYLA
jgi:hypothetical protein